MLVENLGLCPYLEDSKLSANGKSKNILISQNSRREHACFQQSRNLLLSSFLLGSDAYLANQQRLS
jgi:hypothetical protein